MLEYPQFTIINADNLSFELHQDILDRIKRREFGQQSGLSVLSQFESFENGFLAITTNIKYVGILRDSVHEAVNSFYLSIFQFNDQLSILSGVSDEGVSILKKCHQLAQAHAYSIFSLLSTEHEVPQLGMELTPEENYIEHIKEFLLQIALPSE